MYTNIDRSSGIFQMPIFSISLVSCTAGLGLFYSDKSSFDLAFGHSLNIHVEFSRYWTITRSRELHFWTSSLFLRRWEVLCFPANGVVVALVLFLFRGLGLSVCRPCNELDNKIHWSYGGTCPLSNWHRSIVYSYLFIKIFKVTLLKFNLFWNVYIPISVYFNFFSFNRDSTTVTTDTGSVSYNY